MIAFIFKKGDTLGDVDVYLDGTLLDGPGSNTRLIDTKATKLSSASYLLFGTDYASRHAVGLIDDVAIFDEALSLAVAMGGGFLQSWKKTCRHCLRRTSKEDLRLAGPMLTMERAPLGRWALRMALALDRMRRMAGRSVLAPT